jgi:hypothetical protein
MKIPSLEDLSLGHRIVITFLIVMACLFAVALVGFLSGGWEAQGAVEEMPVSRFEGDVLKLDREAMDKALVAHLQLLFTTWMKDYGADGVEARVIRGANNGRKAYIKAREAIERREKQVNP